MIRRISILWALLLALPALAQNTVTTVPTIAALLSLAPSTAKPEVHVLGASVPNDEGGGDYIWIPGSVATTNAYDAIASPYGAAMGRWLKRVNNRPILKDATLKGTSTIAAGGGLVLPSGASLAAASGSTVVFQGTTVLAKPPFTAGPTEPASVLEVEIRSVSMVTDLAAMKALTVNTTVQRLAWVRQTTVTGGISDNAVGFWLWDPLSSAAESPVVQKSSTFPSGDPGRWLKL